MRVQVQIPVRLVVRPSALRGKGLADLEKQLAEQVQKTWMTAQREVAEDGFTGTPRAQVTGFEWQGPGRRALDEPERRQVEKRLRAAIRAASATVLAAPPTRAWRLHPPFEFQARFDRFFEIVKPWWYAGYRQDLEARTGEHFTDSVKAVAWAVDVTRTVSAVELRDALAAERMERRRVLRDERVAGLVRRCPDCGRPMTSLPELYFAEDGVRKWFIEFYCPYDEQIVPVWASEYEALIDETTTGVDIGSLPLWPDGHEEPK